MNTITSKQKKVLVEGTNVAILSNIAHNGTQRSFALNLKGELVRNDIQPKVAAEVAWEISRDIKAKYDGKFTPENAKKAILNHIAFEIFEHVSEDKERQGKVKKAKKVDFHKEVVPAKQYEFTAEQLDIFNNCRKSIPLNDGIAQLIIMGVSMTAIANKLDLIFQRVKNVKKSMLKKGEPRESFTEPQKKLFHTWLKDEQAKKK